MKTSWNGGLPLGCKQKHKQVGNNVAIVDEKGLLVFWAFIYRDPNSICQYITSIHRVTKAKVLGGVQISTVCICIIILTTKTKISLSTKLKVLILCW